MKKKLNPKPRKTKSKYYAIVGKNDKFLHGVFPFSKEGLSNAKVYLAKLDPSEKKFKIKRY